MNAGDCCRESDIVDAVRTGQWPAHCEPGLRAHVERCAVCADVAAVALALRAGCDDAWQTVRVPTAAHVWWRAQLRARQEAVQTAERPMTIVAWVAVASAVGLAAAAIGAGWVAVSSQWLGTLSAPTVVFSLVGAAATLVLIPVAVYFAVSEK